MPRTYKCKTCHQVHPPPTGKQCRQLEETGLEPSDEKQDRILAALEQVTSRMDRMEQQWRPQDNVRVVELNEEDNSETVELQPVRQADSVPASDDDFATPDSLRRNIQLMAQAATRIAQMRSDEQDDVLDTIQGIRARGKKSGSLLTAPDIVEKTIDWPHMHVRRVVNGKRKNLTYNDLSVEEFVYGYISMLKTSRNKMDRDTMIDLLQILMQDAMDFSWGNACGFYEAIGLEVEHGSLRWNNNARIS